MTYYFLFVMLFLVIAYGVDAACKRTWTQWLKASGVVVVGGLMGLLMNLPNMYHTWQYAKESMRGKSELTFAPSKISRLPQLLPHPRRSLRDEGGEPLMDLSALGLLWSSYATCG